jgi:hypothetical protein
VIETHGCIVCAKTLNILAVYSPNSKLVNCTVTSSGGHCVPDEQHILVACDSHTTAEVNAAHKKWWSRNSNEEIEKEQEED